MGKKNNVLTREQREAIELLSKITNKARNELNEFWRANQNQFKQNKVVLKEALKKAIREDKNGDKVEMFNFFWNKIEEMKSTQKGKKNQKGIEINESVINELVVIATLSGNYKYIENIAQKIGYEKLINNGKTYRIMLEAGRVDMFKQLYNKAYELHQDEKVKLPIKVVSTGIIAATEKNEKEALKFCIEKEEGNPDSKLLAVWKETIKALIQTGNIEMAEERLEAVEKQTGIMNNSMYKDIMEAAVISNSSGIFDHCLAKVSDKERPDYKGIFMMAAACDNIYVIEKMGREVSNDILKDTLAAKIVKRESLKDIEKKGEDGNLVTIRREAKENALKTIGDYIISRDKQQPVDSNIIREKSEQFFNKMEKEGNKTIDTISKILVAKDAKNERDVEDIQTNLTLAKLYAQRITIEDRLVVEIEKVAYKDTQFREESKELEQAKETLNIMNTMKKVKETKGNSFVKTTKDLIEISEMISRQTKKLIESSGKKFMKGIKRLLNLDKLKPVSKKFTKVRVVKHKTLTKRDIEKLKNNRNTIKVVKSVPDHETMEQIKSISKEFSEQEAKKLINEINNSEVEEKKQPKKSISTPNKSIKKIEKINGEKKITRSREM